MVRLAHPTARDACATEQNVDDGPGRASGRRLRRRLLIAATLLATACTWQTLPFFPHPATPDAPGVATPGATTPGVAMPDAAAPASDVSAAGGGAADERGAEAPGAEAPPALRPCSLEQVQARKSAARDPQIAGVATPFIIHRISPAARDRFVRSGNVISFVLPDDEPAADLEVTWSLAALDPAGRLLSGNDRLMDGNMIRLRGAADAQTQLSGASNAAPPFIIVKADVPDQTRPTSCDSQVRDGDFVFVHTISPSVWLGATPAGDLQVLPGDPSPREASMGGAADPRCAQDHESCHTDMGGGFVCAWAPSCAK